MPDSFFTSSKPRKRKRTESGGRPTSSNGASNKFARNERPGRHTKNHSAIKANGVRTKKGRVDEELESDQTDEDGGGLDDLNLQADMEVDPGASGEEDEDETPAEKRLRLAKLYLESVKEGLAEGEFDAAEVDKELISARLKQDVMQHSGKVHLFVADSFDFNHSARTVLRTRGHRFSVTSAVAAETGKHLFTAGKEGSIIKWDLTSGKRLATFHKIRPSKSELKGKGKAVADAEIMGHVDEVLALALSDDGKYLVSAGRDRKVVVWDAEKGQWIKGFGGHLGHKDLISALSFRKGTHQLYTGSFDRTLKVYDLSPSVMGYVETLFGHQDHILSIDALRGETCVSVGARDKTARYWKIVEETQLVFRGGGRSKVREVLEGGLRGDDDGDDVDDGMDGSRKEKEKGKEKEITRKFIEGSMECVAMIDESTFVSGGDSGSICLWTTQKKKPIFIQPISHGFNDVHSESEGLIQTPRWVTALASLRYSDLIASGSWEGDIRLWKLDSKLKSFALVGTLPAPGVVNSLQIISTPRQSLVDASWTVPSSANGTDGTAIEPPFDASKSNTPFTVATTRKLADPVLVVAGLGQEHRLGRWISVKEGAVNSAAVFSLCPRTFS